SDGMVAARSSRARCFCVLSRVLLAARWQPSEQYAFSWAYRERSASSKRRWHFESEHDLNRRNTRRGSPSDTATSMIVAKSAATDCRGVSGVAIVPDEVRRGDIQRPA